MSKKCRAYSESKIGLAPADNRKAFYAGWDAALRERLAQPEQEPVAWELRKGKTDRVLLEITNNPQRAHDWKASLEEVVPLYTAPRREWQGLTGEEVAELTIKHAGYPVRLTEAIETKLREKNRD